MAIYRKYPNGLVIDDFSVSELEKIRQIIVDVILLRMGINAKDKDITITSKGHKIAYSIHGRVINSMRFYLQSL